MIVKVYGEPVIELPHDLYIPPDALEIVLEAFEGPLDLLLYLIRKENLNILDIPMAPLTRQYLEYVEAMRSTNLELAAEYLVMAAMRMGIKSGPALAPGAGAEVGPRNLRSMLQPTKSIPSSPRGTSAGLARTARRSRPRKHPPKEIEGAMERNCSY